MNTKTPYQSVILATYAFLLLVLCGCKEEYVPKPRGYFRIDFPAKNYQSYNEQCPYTFEYPVYAFITNDVSNYAEPNWINIEIEANRAKIHLSYKRINNNLEQLVNDSHELAYKHALKADAINEELFINENTKVYGTIYKISGNAASPFQFHLTDSVHHFLRGSFYISETPNYDSLSPVIQFIGEDIFHLIETFNWK